MSRETSSPSSMRPVHAPGTGSTRREASPRSPTRPGSHIRRVRPGRTAGRRHGCERRRQPHHPGRVRPTHHRHRSHRGVHHLPMVGGRSARRAHSPRRRCRDLGVRRGGQPPGPHGRGRRHHPLRVRRVRPPRRPHRSRRQHHHVRLGHGAKTDLRHQFAGRHVVVPIRCGRPARRGNRFHRRHNYLHVRHRGSHRIGHPATGITRRHTYDILGSVTDVRADTGEHLHYEHDLAGRVTTAVSGTRQWKSIPSSSRTARPGS